MFQHEDAQLQCAVTPGATGWDLRARIDPPQACGAELEVDGSEVALVGASGVGEFTFGSVPAGVMRITVTARAGGSLLRTDWFLIGARPDRRPGAERRPGRCPTWLRDGGPELVAECWTSDVSRAAFGARSERRRRPLLSGTEGSSFVGGGPTGRRSAR